MAFNLNFKEEALLDIGTAIEWYESKRTGLGNKFYLEVDSTLNYISKSPELFQVKTGGFREAVLKNFPYSIIYRFAANEIVIFAIFNTYQNSIKRP